MTTDTINAFTNATSSSSSSVVSGGAGSGESAASAIATDFETFLLMLTTQLENQDPLNPIESQDFAVQLATFSGVEQQVRTNDLLENLAGALGQSDLSQLAAWVGMEARIEAPINFDGTPVDIAITPDVGSDAAQLIVLDSLGREVSREAVPLGNDTITWAGVGSDGQPLPAAEYTLQLASLTQGNVTSVQSAPYYARIVEARQGAEEIELVVDGGFVVPSSSASALRAPSSGSE